MRQFDIAEISPLDLIETVREGLIVLDADLTVVSANRSFYASFAVPPEETIGRRLYDLGDGQWNIPELRHLLEEILPKEQVVEGYEVDHVFPLVGRKVMHLNARRIVRAGDRAGIMLVTFYDVTEAHNERLRAEGLAKVAQEIADTVRDPLVILDGDMRIVTASRKFQQLFGDLSEAVVGKHLDELKQGQWGVAALRDLLDVVVSDDRPFDGFLLEDDFPGLGHRIFKLNARKIEIPGQAAKNLLLSFEDATDATMADRHREVLSAELAHRIKNNLQVISAFVAYEIRRAAEPCREGYRAMQTRIMAVAELYDVIARSSAFGPVAVPEYFEGIASGIRDSMIGEGSLVEIAVEAEPLSIAADHAVPIGLMVNELATNALKYAFPGGAGRLTLGFQRRDGEVTLTVNDDGVGIGAATGVRSGSGLGTRFVDAFVGQVGGVLAKATGPTGTTFTVRLPASVLATAEQVV